MRAGSLASAKRFGADRNGATAVEFALILAPFIAVILFTLQCVLILFCESALQSAAHASARQLMTGNAQTSGMTQSQFHALVCANATAFFNCANIMVDVQSAPSFTSVNTAPIGLTYDGAGAVSNSWNYRPGTAGDTVILRVLYNWPVLGGPMAFGLANQPGGNHLLVGTSVFKNEPYQ
jgi:Flp pilus assembly protein TadG